MVLFQQNSWVQVRRLGSLGAWSECPSAMSGCQPFELLTLVPGIQQSYLTARDRDTTLYVEMAQKQYIVRVTKAPLPVGLNDLLWHPLLVLEVGFGELGLGPGHGTSTNTAWQHPAEGLAEPVLGEPAPKEITSVFGVEPVSMYRQVSTDPEAECELQPHVVEEVHVGAVLQEEIAVALDVDGGYTAPTQCLERGEE